MASSSCPGLDLSHGFIHHIRKHQFTRLHQDQNIKPPGKPPIGKKSSTKPTLAPYRPPGVRLKESNSMQNELGFPNTRKQIDRKTESRNESSLERSENSIPSHLSDINIEGYIPEAQPYIQKAIIDPCSLDRPVLCEVASVIVTRAWEDQGYFSLAAKLCAHIAEIEHTKQDALDVPDYAFSRSVIENCQHVYQDYEALRCHDMKMWLAFVRFVAAIYMQMRYKNTPIKSLCDILLSLLKVLARPPSCWNFDEAELLSSSLHDCGEVLNEQDGQSLSQLIAIIRDCVLHADTQTHIRRMLLELIELSASDWKLPPGASHYYYGGF